MVYSFFNKLLTTLAGTELVTVDNGGGIDVGATTGLIAGAPQAAGGGAVTFKGAGNIATVVPGQDPANTGGDYVVGVVTLPAGSFAAAGQSVTLKAAGNFAANGNTKQIRIQASATLPVVGTTITSGTVIADTTAVTTSGGGWELEAEVTKYGVAGSNTQISVHENVAGVGAVALVVPKLLTYTESSPIYLAVTINCTTAITDAFLNLMQAFWQN